MDKTNIDLSMTERFSEIFNSSPAYRIASRAVFNNGLMDSAADPAAIAKLSKNFTVDLKQGAVTNQKQSGRCWIFSALNVFRYELMQKYSLKDFELSQNFLYFYDKLEKSNYYLETMLELKDEPEDGRLFCFLNSDPIADGGQWDMISNLVKKYGVVPKYIYPDSKSAETSRWMREAITSKLREDAYHLRSMARKGEVSSVLREKKEEMLAEIYRILCICLGEPPKHFDLVARDKDDNPIVEYDLTPKGFFDKYIGIDLSSMVSLVNAPADNKPMDRLYTVKYLGNVKEGDKVSYLNTDIAILKEAVIRQLKDGHPVWFGSDCSKFSLRKSGIFDRASMNIEELFDIRYEFTKGERLIYGDSAMNHAMVILGVNMNKEGCPDKWHIENSWGKDAGMEGHYVASDPWFDEFVYQVVVDKKYLDKKTLALLEGEYIELEPWDPLGSLAR